MAVVVFPTPPFWFAIAIILPISSLYFYGYKSNKLKRNSNLKARCYYQQKKGVVKKICFLKKAPQYIAGLSLVFEWG